MKTVERPEYKLYYAHTKPASDSAQQLQRLFTSHILERQDLRLVYELDAAALPTSLEQRSIRHILGQFLASGHKVDIVFYDESWYGTPKIPSSETSINALVASLQSIAPQHITLHPASELRRTSTIDMLYAGLDAIALPELIGSGKGVNKKNSSRSMDSLLRRGFSRMLWQQLAADVALQLESSKFTMSSTTVTSLIIPLLPGIRTNDLAMADQAGHHTLFRAVMNIPDEQLLDVIRYMLVLNQDDQMRITDLLATQPLEAKKQLAVVLAALHANSFEEGLLARKVFEETMSGQSEYIDATWHPDTTLFDVLAATNICSRSELRRLFAGGAVRSITQPTRQLSPDHQTMQHDDIIRVGKKHRIRIRVV